MRRPYTLLHRDDLLAATVAALLLVAGRIAGFAWPDTLAGAALALPLAWRSRAPGRALAVLAVGVFAYLALAVDPAPLFSPPLILALYSVAASGPRRRTLAVAGALVPFVVFVVVLFSPDEGGPVRQVLAFVTQLGLVLAVGEAVRTQRAYAESRRERAERAERERRLETQRRVDEERMRIARDVHDVVAHSVATVSTQAAVGVHLGRQEPDRALEMLEAIKEVSTSALQDLRQSLGVLRENADTAPTRPAPSLRELPELVGTARSSGLPVVLRMEGSPANLPPAVQLAVYRIVQEGLTNVIRHAGGAHATVRVAVAGPQVEVDVTNDGSGRPDPATAEEGSGSGLVGMRERAAALGGTLHAGRERGGFGVHAVLPLDAPRP